MPAPSTSDEYLNLVHKSGLISFDRLELHLQTFRDAGTLPAQPRKLAELLIRDGFLHLFPGRAIPAG